MIVIRPADASDTAALLAWRNDPATRSASLASDEITWGDHVAWFTRALIDPSRRIMIAELRGTPIATVRFDRDGDEAEVSINLAPEARGKRLAGPVLQAAIDDHLATPGAPTVLVARIRDDNVASIRVFTASGFQPTGSVEGVGRYRRQSSSDQETGVPASAS